MSSRGLVIIPAYNEAHTIAAVLLGLRSAAPSLDRLVVNDGSSDGTAQIVTQLREKLLNLPCNLGYGRALQAAIKYAIERGYDFVVFFDGDGQHHPEDVPRLVSALLEGGADVMIGSRFVKDCLYTGPLGRRIGMLIFSHFSRLLLGRRIYDTTSGLKAVRMSACRALVRGTFMDFHTEALVRLSLLGFSLAELPVTMQERAFGQSMHSVRSAIEYPIKTFLLTLVAAVDALVQRRIQ